MYMLYKRRHVNLLEELKVSVKKKLSRNWYKLTFFLNEEFAIPIVDEESHPRRTRYHNNGATVCTTPLTLKTDCI